MKFLPLTDLGKRLRPKYCWPISALIMAGIVGSFIPSGLFAVWLAHTLHLRNHGPALAQENGGLWFFLFVAFMLTSLIVGYLGSFVVLAAILCWFYGWTPVRLRELIFESRVPPHWFKHHPEA